MLIHLKRNDDKQTLVYPIQNEDGSIPILKDASVRFVMGKKNKLIVDSPAYVQSETNGIVAYDFKDDDTLIAGTYMAEFIVSFPGGEQQTYPTKGTITVHIEANLDRTQSNVVVDMLAERQGEFTKKLESILQQAGNITMSTMNEHSWTAEAGQLTYNMPTNANYDPFGKWFEVYVGGIPVDPSLIDRSRENQFTLLIESSLVPAGVNVIARWTEPIVPVTVGHHSVHEENGADEIDITKLKGYKDLEVSLAEKANLDLIARTIEPKFDGLIPAQNPNRWFQSFCYIEHDNVLLVGYCTVNGEERYVDIVKFNASNYSVIQTYTNLELFHINDMTYNPTTNEIIVATLTDPNGNNRLAVVDYTTMTIKNTVSVSGISGIATVAYEKDKNEYVVYRTGGISILNSNFTLVSAFDITSYPEHILQSCEYVDGLIYIYFNHLIWVYDRKGTRIREWYIPVHNEGEGIAYVGNGDFLIGQISPASYQFNPRLFRFNMYEEFNSANWTTVSSLSELGLIEGSETITTLCVSMSEKSRFLFPKTASNTSTAYPASVGLLEIFKLHDNHVVLKFYSEIGEEWRSYYNKSGNPTFSGWVKTQNSTVKRLDVVDLNTLIEPGHYYVIGSTSTNIPESGNSGYLTVQQFSPTYIRQTWSPSYQTGSHFYVRNMGNGIWNPWHGYFPQLNGSGSPESVVSSRIGGLYVDTTGGKLYFKKSGSGSTGWQILT